MSGDNEFNYVQFVFIEGRGTDMDASLTHDIISHCISRGFTVYTCSLDAEGAFEAIPHVILFKKAMGFIPDIYWRLLVAWGHLVLQHYS